MVDTRKERDSMGEMEVPSDAYYGASTQRAVINFPISELRLSRTFIRALGPYKDMQPTSIWSSETWLKRTPMQLQKRSGSCRR